MTVSHLLIRGLQAVYAEGQRDFAPVMQVMFQHMPHHPTSREHVAVAPRWIIVGEGVRQIGGSPAVKAILHELP